MRIRDESKSKEGECVRDDVKKCIELCDEHGCENFDSVHIATSRKPDDAPTDSGCLNYDFHLVVHNVKKQLMIDVSNGKLIVSPVKVFFDVHHQVNDENDERKIRIESIDIHADNSIANTRSQIDVVQQAFFLWAKVDDLQ